MFLPSTPILAADITEARVVATQRGLCLKLVTSDGFELVSFETAMHFNNIGLVH